MVTLFDYCQIETFNKAGAGDNPFFSLQIKADSIVDPFFLSLCSQMSSEPPSKKFTGKQEFNKDKFTLLTIQQGAMSWSRKTTWAGVKPSPRFAHSATVVQNNIFIMGGEKTTETRFKDVHVLNLGTLLHTYFLTFWRPNDHFFLHTTEFQKITN